MPSLNIDIETYSPVDLRKAGVHRYAEHPDFEILLFGYSLDGAPPVVIDLAQGEELPAELINQIGSPAVIKRAFNAAFEIACLSAYLGRPLDPASWRCTSVLALTLGLPGHLFDVTRALRLPVEQQKTGVGRSLISYFCQPCRPTRTNGGRLRNLPHHDPDRWALFKDYCRQDVVAEQAVHARLARWEPPPAEQALWVLDQKINARGIQVDRDLIEAAIDLDNQARDAATAEFASLTGISKATQVARLKKWLSDEHDIKAETLNKDAVKALLVTHSDTVVERALKLRQELSKSSVAKYTAMAASRGLDGRIRGLLQFYGANRTGRWAGRLVQIQNLPRSALLPADLSLARQLVKQRDGPLLQLLYGPVPALLSELIRTAFIPGAGCFFVVVDFAAIEARVLAWAADERWRLEVFRTHGRIYEASAARMFRVPIESIDKHSPLRQKGKVSELALGYHGSVGALVTMGALSMGLTEQELPGIVTAWRAANPNIMTFGYGMERHAKQALQTRVPAGVPGRYRFRFERGVLFLELPSGRSLAYAYPRIEETGGYRNLTYDGINQETKRRGRIETYAGKLLENYTQACARDCLAAALPALEAAGLPVVGHVHDEAIIEASYRTWPNPRDALFQAEEIFSRRMPWAPDLPLAGDGFISDFYRKDA